MDERYAKDIFPYAGLDPSLTFLGLVDHRATTKRQEWAKVLCGSDEEIAQSIARLVPDWAANFNVGPEAHTKFCKHIVGELESVILGKIDMQRWRDFAAGFQR